MKEVIEMLLKKYRVEELAVKLGVSSSSIFKWKAGNVKPSRLAQEKIKKIVKNC